MDIVTSKFRRVVFLSSILWTQFLNPIEAMEEEAGTSLISLSNTIQRRQALERAFPVLHSEDSYETVAYESLDCRGLSSCRIDLHGKSLSDARETVLDVLQKIHSLGFGGSSIHFICGRGNHKSSKGERGVLFKHFPEWLLHESVVSLIESYHQTVGAYEVFLKSLPFEEIKPVSCKTLKVEVIHQLAEFGEFHAQFILGKMYMEGDRVGKNNTLAVKWFRQSAKQGFSDAQLMLGFMCAMGMGTKYNPQEALRWYCKAGMQGNSKALHNIAVMYYTGEGVPQNFKKAAHYYHEAAALNDPVAMNMLGIIYLHGQGVEQNDAEAVRWYRQGAEAGEPHAKVNLGSMLLTGRGVERNEVEGVKWLREGAEYGLAEGQMRLGMAYEKGQGVGQDYKEAAKWYLRAALQESGSASADAQFLLARLYENGTGVKQDIDLANQWLLRAAKNKLPAAQTELGHHYRFGIGFTRDYAQALKYYRLAAEQGNASAQYNFGEMCELGQGIPRDEKQALYWIKRAAKGGYLMALARLGVVFNDLQEIAKSSLVNPSYLREFAFCTILPTPSSKEVQKDVVTASFSEDASMTPDQKKPLVLRDEGSVKTPQDQSQESMHEVPSKVFTAERMDTQGVTVDTTGTSSYFSWAYNFIRDSLNPMLHYVFSLKYHF